MNSYNIYEEEHYSTILYHAIARDEKHARELAEEAGINLENLTIDLEREDLKDQLGKPCDAVIRDAQVR